MRLMSLACAILFVAIPATRADDKVELKEFESKDGKFKMMLPGKPTEQKQKIETAIGDLNIVLFLIEINKESAVVVSYNDYPDAIKAAPAGTVLDGAVGGVIGKGKKVSSKEIKYKDTKIEGREFEYTNGDKTGKARVFLDGARMYQILILGTEEKLKAIDTKKIFESFEITSAK